MARPDADFEPFIVVAVDFGTTFTGVAYAFVTDAKSQAGNVTIIQDWPGSNHTSDKVPTRFAYVAADDLDSSLVLYDQKSASAIIPYSGQSTQAPEPIFKWGFEVDPGDPVIECIKLFLEDDRELPKHIRRDEINSQLGKYGKSPQDAVSDYLKRIHAIAEKSLIDKYGANCIAGTKRKTILTVPAMWSERAKAATQRAAINAGFATDMLLVSEPEAAAIWTIQKTPWLEASVGDNFLVCDAGGGTVDLITYEITQVSPFRVRESMTGSGGLCGASFLNRRFEQRISDKIGITEFAKFKKTHAQSWHAAMEKFEEKPKRNFNPSMNRMRSFPIPCPNIPNNEEAGSKNGFITLSNAALEEIFEPLVTEVMGLIEKQVEGVQLQQESVQAIMLVGGFGQSNHLLESIRANSKFQGINILQPPQSWSSIARGAVLWACELENFVESRKARYHYGTHLDDFYRPGVHPPDSKYYCPFKETFLSADRFDLFIRKGQSVSAATPIYKEYLRTFSTGDDLSVEDELVISTSDTVPNGCNDRGCRVIGTLRTDLGVVPKRLWKAAKNASGKRYRVLDFAIKVELTSGGLRFSLEVDEVEYNAVTTKFESGEATRAVQTSSQRSKDAGTLQRINLSLKRKWDED